MSDNIGGIKKIYITLPNHVKGVVNIDGCHAKIFMQPFGQWADIPFQHNSVKMNLPPTSTNSETLYDIDISFNIPRHLFSGNIENIVKSATINRCLLKYETNNDEEYIVGTETYTLKVEHEILHPGNPSGFSGHKITLSGKLLHPQLQLTES